MSLQFEWDGQKASANFRKHKVSFDEATTVFDDPLANIFDDEDHSADEYREVIIGQSVLRRLVVVCFTERFKNIVRIYSARPATRHELNDYQENADSEIS